MAIEIKMSVEGLQVSAKVKRPRRLRSTVVELHRRHLGTHRPIGEPLILAAPYAKIVKHRPLNTLVHAPDGDRRTIDEERILASLPDGFLPVPARKVLLVIDGKGWRETKIFRSWGKYFDAYSLFVSRGPKS